MEWCGMDGTWVSCDLLDATWGTETLALSLISLWMRAPSRAGWQWDLQECLLVAVLQETLTFSLQSTSPGWLFPTVQAKCTCYHSGIAAGPSCASFPGSCSSRAHAGKWKIQNSSSGHSFTFLFSPAGSFWASMVTGVCMALHSPVGNVKNTSYNFPFPHTKIY